MSRRRAVLLFLFLGACQHQPARSITVASDTAVVLAGLCDRALLSEAGSSPVYVAATTGHLLNAEVLVALKVASGAETFPEDFVKAGHTAERLNGDFTPSGVTLPRKSRCSFTLGDAEGTLPLTLDISAAFANPYAPKEGHVGYVARLQIGGQAHSWYWVELHSSSSVPRVADVVRLPIDH